MDTSRQAPDEGKGDSGKDLTIFDDAHYVRSDFRLCRKAVTGGWNWDEGIRQLVKERVGQILRKVDDDGNPIKVSNSTILSAVNTFQRADAQDQAFQLAKDAQSTEFLRPDPLPAASAPVNVEVNVNSQAVAVSATPKLADPWADIDGMRREFQEAAEAEARDGTAPPSIDDERGARPLAGISPDSHPRKQPPGGHDSQGVDTTVLADESASLPTVPEDYTQQGVMESDSWTMPDRADEPEKPSDVKPYSAPLSTYARKIIEHNGNKPA